jgi:hypothetical protein
MGEVCLKPRSSNILASSLNLYTSTVRDAKTMLAKIKFHEIYSWNQVGAHLRCMLLLYKRLVGSILDYASVCYSGMARTHFLKLKRLQYRCLRIALGLFAVKAQQ